ncbi:MAG: hypothetical protein O7B99_11400 [Planctomycetota bacterium]|nr:hypothetical protein [Planctomycetota bacterium]
MRGFIGHPALGVLLRLKLRGVARKQWRRMRSPSGLVLTLLGVGLFGIWLSFLAVHALVGDGGFDAEPRDLRAYVRVGATMITVMSLSGSLTHRGLYLPREEIERLFSAPVKRSDLIRYRLLVNAGRAFLGGVILGLVTMRHMPHPMLSFVGVFVALQTLPLLGQACAILAGGLEKRLFQRFRRMRTVVVILVLLLGGGIFYLAIADRSVGDTPMGSLLGSSAGALGFHDVLHHPILVTVTSPFEVWARMIAAPTTFEFLIWFGVSLLIWASLFELTARLPIDFRELSLETSASVAERLRRISRGGGGASAGRITRRAVGWRIPWLFGHGPVGALAWRKTGAILRKARGTVIVSALVLAFVILLSVRLFDDENARLFGPLFVALLGLFYLGAGLRFDFRDELDRMESIKAWPLSSARIFVAMILPEVVLVSLLLVGAMIVRGALAGGLDGMVLACALAMPLVVLAWVAMDNAIFLLVPVRFVPGQEGALQNAGRGMIMLLLRAILLAFSVSLVGGSFFVTGLVLEALSVEPVLVRTIAFLVAWTIMLGIDFVLIWFGGVMFRRFDVARDRG